METLEIRQKVYDMMLYSNNILHNYPAYEKQALCRTIRETMLRMYKNAVYLDMGYATKTAIRELDTENAILKGLIRFSFETVSLESRKGKGEYPPSADAGKRARRGYIDRHTYEVWSKMSYEIGCMIGGLKKSIAEGRQGQRPSREATAP